MKNKIYLDTNILIYLLEKHKDYSQQVARILEDYSKKDSIFITSTVTITEFLAGTTSSNLEILQQIPQLSFINLNDTLAEKASTFQKENKMQIGDAIHLATAIDQNSKSFFTNDKLLAKIAQRYIQIIDLPKN